MAVALPALTLGVLAWRHRWVADDAYINFRVVDNLIAGSGPVFNDGERVETYTSTAWLTTLALAHGVLRLPLEWTSVVLGLLLTVAGLAAASYAALLLCRALGRRALGIPLGALVLVALRPMWDFTTSGLDTGLGFGWLGVTFLAVVALYLRCSSPAGIAAGSRFHGIPPWAIGVLAGLGPLIRPDFALFSAGFLVALIAAARLPSRRSVAMVLAAAAVLPVAYQVFRMGYFAALVPNTAFAKEAGEAYWGRGFDYLANFVNPYVLWLPCAIVFALIAGQARDARAAGGWRLTVILLAPPVCGLLHALYVVRVGGDFMHGRLLLPGLFALLLPLMVYVPSSWRRPAAVAAAVVVGWSAVCLVALKVPPITAKVVRFQDERAVYLALSRNPHPITPADYALSPWAKEGRLRRALVGRQRVVKLFARSQLFVADEATYPDPPAAPSLPSEVVSVFAAIGVAGDAAGRQVHIADRLGLADPIGARIHPRPLPQPGGGVLPARFRPGHEKALPLEWVIARFADFDTSEGRRLAAVPAVASARRALRCGNTRRLLQAVESPLTLRRFVSNLGLAWRLHGFRLDPEPERAERQSCG